MKKFALITGASGEIGSAIALKLASLGYSLYLHYSQNEEGVRELLQQLSCFNQEYLPIQADFVDDDGVRKLASQIFSLDCIVHNAGQSHYGMLEDLTESELDHMMKVHVHAPILITKYLLPKLTQKQNGRIVVISSIWGQTGAACEVAYSTAKGAQLSFVKALSKEVARSGITVNAVAPGSVMSPMLQHLNEVELHQLSEEIPIGRLGTPADVAEAVSFLLADGSAYITGQTIAVNGGWYM